MLGLIYHPCFSPFSLSPLLTAFCLFESLYLLYMRLLVIESLQVPPADAVPPGFFKEVISVLEPSVPGLINSSLSSGVVPKTFKHATLLMPLLSNFRPVSKLPSFQRFWRKLFIASGQPFKIKYDVFEVFQSNFKCLHDTESALMRVF